MQGQSEYTQFKQAVLQGFLTITLPQAKRLIEKNCHKTYVWIDATSGSGWNDEVNVPGSPLIAKEAFKKAGIDAKCFFIEQNNKSIAELKNRLPEDNCLLGRYEEVLSKLHGSIHSSKPPVGCIYFDTNGGFLYPQAIFSFLARYRYIDLFVNFHYANWKRTKRGVENAKHTRVDNLLELADFIRCIPKTTVMLRRTSDFASWSHLYASNHPRVPFRWDKKDWFVFRLNNEDQHPNFEEALVWDVVKGGGLFDAA